MFSNINWQILLSTLRQLNKKIDYTMIDIYNLSALNVCAFLCFVLVCTFLPKFIFPIIIFLVTTIPMEIIKTVLFYIEFIKTKFSEKVMNCGSDNPQKLGFFISLMIILCSWTLIIVTSYKFSKNVAIIPVLFFASSLSIAIITSPKKLWTISHNCTF